MANKIFVDGNFLFEILLRIVATSAISYFVYTAVLAWNNTPAHYTLIVLIVSECLTSYFLLTARIPKIRDWRITSVLATNIATFYFLFLSLGGGHQLIPESFGVAIQVTGLAWQIFSKISLGRSFGLLPASRKLVVRGAYRVVRHPIYLGYFIAHMGFLLANFELQNLLTLTALYLTQAYRILQEERILGQNTDYDNYKSIVKYRLVPFLF